MADPAPRETPSGGALVIVGAGITAMLQVTPEARQQIRAADIVFYNAGSALAERFIRQENPNAVDLGALYGEGKRRRLTYVQMAEAMLREVRRGCLVVGVFPGHPGLLNMPARRAMMIAKDEGLPAWMLPAVSSVDCMICDLGIDPGVNGLQIMKAGLYLQGKQALADWGHVALIQIGSLGDSGFSFSGYTHNKFGALVEKLSAHYGSAQEAVYYQAPAFPGEKARIEVRPLADWQGPEIKIGGGILYLPPCGSTFDDTVRYQAFQGRAPYDAMALQAIEDMVDPATQPRRRERPLRSA